MGEFKAGSLLPRSKRLKIKKNKQPTSSQMPCILVYVDDSKFYVKEKHLEVAVTSVAQQVTDESLQLRVILALLDHLKPKAEDTSSSSQKFDDEGIGSEKSLNTDTFFKCLQNFLEDQNSPDLILSEKLSEDLLSVQDLEILTKVKNSNGGSYFKFTEKARDFRQVYLSEKLVVKVDLSCLRSYRQRCAG